MARSSAGRPDSDEPEAGRSSDSIDEAGTDVDEGEVRRTRSVDAFWKRVRVDPIELALPSGAGYTLRAYRMESDVTPSDYTAREDVEFPDRVAVPPTTFDGDESDDDADLDDADLDAADADLDAEDADGEDDAAEDRADEDDADEDEDEEYDAETDADADSKAAAARADEEVPLFLSQNGNVLVFRSRAGLVEFLQSGAEHDLTQLDTWSQLVDGIAPEHIVALPDDTYELDLVVKNLRGSHDVWEPELIVQSGQVARDLGHALRIDSVVRALSPGSPLDDLDEALRGVAAGGVGAFFARRKAKKIGTETASLSWRTVIGKISAVVDWRD